MHAIRSFGYVIGRGFRGMAQAPLVQLLAIATTAVCMLLLGTVMLAWTNARGVADAWGIDVPMTIYLVDHADQAEAEALGTRLGELPQVQRVDFVTPDQAMDRLAEGLAGDPSLLEGIESEVLPASLEVYFVEGVSADFAPALRERVESLGPVQEVAVAGDWVGRVDQMLQTLGDLALGAAAMVGLACMAIVWSTIRLAVYARRAEIQILRLVGGTARFVRGPFIVEGCVQGALGAAVALCLLWLGFDAMQPFLERGLSLMFASGALTFFTPLQVGCGIAFGGLIGVAGSWAATSAQVET